MDSKKLEHLRHSLAHLLAAAVLKLYPDAKPTLGPAIDNGFYYDFDFPTPVAETDLPKIQNVMREILKTWDSFEGEEVPPEEARKRFQHNPYKLELIDEIVGKKEPLTLYTSGTFTDLCRGGHVEDIKEIKPDAFELSRLAGAYWRGDEKNKMLTRIYGLAFPDKKELEEYKKMMAEAEKRDHRKLGKDLKFFTFDDDVGPGLPLWLPNGTVVIEELEKLAKKTEKDAGYKQVRTPHIAKESMYKKSGHLPYYEETMFPPMEYEGGRYYLRAMNCPHHHKIFASEKRSYKDLPLRLSEYGTVYRHEKSGELFGLMRVRMLQMNDAHIYCSEEQFADEFRKVNDMYLHYFKIFGLGKYVMRFSTHDPKKLGEKYVDEPELWEKTENMVRNVLVESKIPYVEVPNEAAFYGPKIDVQVWSAIGREFTLATNQVDFAVPKRFNLTYTTKEGREETPLCIHRAPLGTHERFIGFLIEHYAGAFPYWLSPVQVKVLSIGENHKKFSKKVSEFLNENNVRVELDDTDEGLGKKIRAAKVSKVPYIFVIGDKEVEAESVTIESRDKGNIGVHPLDKIIPELK
ncbi:MAG: threonine--tRNA ligase [Patescibacteria group bacterium]|nr:threonine--tRNA ligase [bacterium]MDZ4240602.1 threonine--tRNA ligase [Patescibacteria group bacterium]